MADRIEESKAGKYELIKNDTEKSKSEGGRLYYQTYIPASLKNVKVAADEENAGLKRIYQEIGKMQGFGFFERNLEGKSRKLRMQEVTAMLESEGNKPELPDRFSNQPANEIKEKMQLYDFMEKENNYGVRKILLGGAHAGARSYGYRTVQVWEDKEVKRVSLREHNPSAPKHIPELMEELEEYSTRKDLPDPIIHVGLLCYQFLTIMPFEKDNEIWVSLLINCFLREHLHKQDIRTEYYVPFGRYLLDSEEERKEAMRQVRESGDYGIWLHYFVEMTGRALERTNRMIMAVEQLHKESFSSIIKEKQRELLQDIIIYMEETPVFAVADIEEAFDIAYNTAAKMINILKKHDIVREISERQRYRIFCYESYVQEIL